MELLTGEYRNTLDEKGRIPFPAKLRFELTGENLIITQAVDRCLWLFPAEEWKNFSEKLTPAQSVDFDKSGRLSIPPSLREYASLSKECIFLGINKYIELWDAAAYKAYLDENEPVFREAAEELRSIYL